MQNALQNNIKGLVTSIGVILRRFDEYVRLAKTAALNTPGLETINVIDEISVGMKSANSAVHRKGSRMTWHIEKKDSSDVDLEPLTIEMPNCLPIMKQALYQIVDNAVKYSSESTELEIMVDEKPDGDSKRMSISFSNQGPKVHEDEVDIIFEKSVRGENAELFKPDSGFGLGLSLVDKIVSCHKWIDAFVYADSGPVEFSFNNIDYATFTITINFSKELVSACDTVSDLLELKEDVEMMFKHELAGSMPELTRLAYEIAIQTINSSVYDNSTKTCAFDLFDSILDFLFYLNGLNVAGRPMELRQHGVAADRMIDRFVRWAYVYRLGEKPPQSLWERVDPFAPLPLFNSVIVASWMLAKDVVDNGKNLIMRSYDSHFEIHSEKIFDRNAFPISIYSLLFAESGLILTIDKNCILIKKIKK